MRSNSSRATDVAGFPTQIQRIPGDVPQTVSALIDATRRLQSSLQLWSTQQISEVEVSDVFVAVGNEFNAMVAAFQYYNIDMSDVLSFTDELRTLLEECLSEDPTPENVGYLMPQVRTIIASLLTGLRNKQAIYWEAVRADRQGRR